MGKRYSIGCTVKGWEESVFKRFDNYIYGELDLSNIPFLHLGYSI
jgi:hypothetical protein